MIPSTMLEVAVPVLAGLIYALIWYATRGLPDGAKMAKIHWTPKQNSFFPDTTVPGMLHDVDFMVKDSKRFADSGGWGWAAFVYDAASSTFRPAGTSDRPPQENDAKCGLACHTAVQNRDYVFSEYGRR